MKNLFYIPIVHSQSDLGSLGSQLSLEGERKYGVTLWQEHLKEVNKSWDKIEIGINKQIENISFDKIKIFQDGLPAAGDIGLKIIKDAADKGSKNYRIIDNLLSKGAILEIAENKEFLLKEYHLLSEIGKAETTEKQLVAYSHYQELAKELLNDRDNFIANQINSSLNEEETGIAFFGAAHSIIEKLNKDINVVVIQMFNDDISLNLIKKE
jgi:hypothetical protein